MTLIATFVNKDLAVAYSEGHLVFDDQVIDNRSDKTFSLYNNSIIGAFSGDIILNKPDGSGTSIGKILSEYEKANPDAEFSDFLTENIETINNCLSVTHPYNDKLVYLHIIKQINEPDAKFHCYRYQFSTESDGDKKKIVVKCLLDKPTNDIHSYDGEDRAVAILDAEFKAIPASGTKVEIIDWFNKAFTKACAGSTKILSGDSSCGGDQFQQIIE
jgi:hypothetical protein